MDKGKEIQEMQKSIDEQIEELADDIECRLKELLSHFPKMEYGTGHWIAADLVPKYRKADEVRKETLREIDKLAAECGLDEFRAVHLRKYAKQRGVEVDE